MKKAVIASLDSLELTINNLHQTRSRRHYNCYRANYPSIYDESPFLKPELVVETYVALLPFPTITKMVDNYLYRFLEKIDALHIAQQYNLIPFPITTQTMERTLIDKIYAICDYYLEKKVDRHSRHLYDIYKIYNQLEITENFCTLVSSVRKARAEISICPFAMEGISINSILTEIINTDVYQKDYKDITEGLLFKPLSYDEAVTGLKAIVDANIFY